MTLSITAPTQSPVVTRQGPFPPPPLATPCPANERGNSDSVVPSCRMTEAKRSQAVSGASPAPGTPPIVEALQSSDAAHWSVPSRRLAKQGLRLPSFHSLGIASPPYHPTALLTPPEDSIPATRDASSLPLNGCLEPPSVPLADLPNTPESSDTTPRPMRLPEANPLSQIFTVTTPQGHVSTANSQPTPPVMPFAGGGHPALMFMDPTHAISKPSLSPLPCCLYLS